MTKLNDCYPGTTDRTMGISGTIIRCYLAVCEIQNFILSGGYDPLVVVDISEGEESGPESGPESQPDVKIKDKGTRGRNSRLSSDNSLSTFTDSDSFSDARSDASENLDKEFGKSEESEVNNKEKDGSSTDDQAEDVPETDENETSDVVKGMVQEFEFQYDRLNSGRVNDTKQQKNTDVKNEPFKIFRMILPQTIIGAIIGTKASHINSVIKESNCDIKISKDPRGSLYGGGSGSTGSNLMPKYYLGSLRERILILKSTNIDNIKKALKIIFKKLMQYEVKYDHEGVSYNMIAKYNLIANANYDRNEPYAKVGHYFKMLKTQKLITDIHGTGIALGALEKDRRGNQVGNPQVGPQPDHEGWIEVSSGVRTGRPSRIRPKLDQEITIRKRQDLNPNRDPNRDPSRGPNDPCRAGYFHKNSPMYGNLITPGRIYGNIEAGKFNVQDLNGKFIQMRMGPEEYLQQPGYYMYQFV